MSISSAHERQAPRRHEVVIVGAGFAGIGMAITLKRAGLHDFVVLEAADRVGGTWRENDYPGCGCDVPSHLYSFSFEPNPDWSRTFAGRAEIQAYLERCVERYDLGRHLRFGVEFSGARLDDRTGSWTIHTQSSTRAEATDETRAETPAETIDEATEKTTAAATLTAGALVLGLGPLHRPRVPDLPGLTTFQGEKFHSAQWNHDYDLSGKRVAVVGTGASAIQFVPEIAPKVGELHIFQRTAPWIVPRPDRAVSAGTRTAFRRVPALQRAYRQSIYWRLEARALGFARPQGLKPAEWVARAHLRRSTPEPDLRARLTPDYAIGCKRILLSNDYYPALRRPNVHLIAGAPAELREREVITADGRALPIDAVIFGTGFEVVENFRRLSIVGADGQSLERAWAGGVRAYLGTLVAGFPNLFLLLGPNTGLGHNSVVFMAERQMRFILRCLLLKRRAGARAISVRPEAQAAFNAEIQRRLRKAVWSAGGCTSWYLDADGVNRTLWPGFSWRFAQRTRQPNPADLLLAGAAPTT